MERSGFGRFAIIGLGILVFILFIYPKLSGDGPRFQPLGKEGVLAPAVREPEGLCEIRGARFTAQLSTRDASLKHLFVEGTKYTVDGRRGSAAMDMVTTPDVENRRPLRIEWRAPGAESQVAYDLFDWQLASQTGTECVFTYQDERVELRRIVRASERPFELDTELTVTNKGEAKATHRTAIEAVSWHTDKDVEGSLGRQSPWQTEVECSHDGELTEKHAGDFAPKEFSKPEFRDGWFTQTGNVDFVSVTSHYFATAIVPLTAPTKAGCQLQVEERWNSKAFATKKDDPNAGAMYRARLTYEPKELAPGETATYTMLSFVGPKERGVLAQAGGGTHRLSELIHFTSFLGLKLAVISRLLVAFMVFWHTKIGSWGAAIIMLTLAMKMLLFPLTWRSIQSGVKMRKLMKLMKPELDEINTKYADDAMQKQLATAELYRKHGSSQFAPLSGCLPMLLQMPVWFALYSALQTAAELYHTPFLWFHDLSAPDTIRFGSFELPFVLPFLLGATALIQQKIMPQQQMDPAQQKMMTYMMPTVFTVMMLFLPAGLGVYMFTNSLVSIAQQLAVEKYYGSGGNDAGGIRVREKNDGDAPSSAASNDGEKRRAALALGKGKPRVTGL